MIKKYILVIIAITIAVWIVFFFRQKSAVAPAVPVNNTVSVAQ